jgi:hypothetical protein
VLFAIIGETGTYSAPFLMTQFQEIVWDGVDFIHLAKDSGKRWALVNMVINLRGP